MSGGQASSGNTRVAFLSPSWPPERTANGIVTYVERISGALRRLGHRTCILSAGSSCDGLGPDVYLLWDQKRARTGRILDGIAFRLNQETAFRRRYAACLVAAAQRAVADRGVELLEMEETFGLAHLLKPRLAIPVVVRLHGPFFANAPHSAVTMEDSFDTRVRLEGVGIARADAVSAVSKHILEKTRAHYGLPLAGAAVIPNPAPIVPGGERWRLGECDPSRILFVGRFDRVKGGDVVIDCLRILTRRFPDLRLWFVGPDKGFTDDRGKCWSLAEYLSQRAAEVAACVEWLGQQPPPAVDELRRKAMLTVVASRYEAFGLTALEAMAYGCPMVATNAGGISETVSDEVNGLLCRPGDAEHMAAQVARLLSDANLAARLGRRAAQDAATCYHPDAIARKTADFYRSVLSEGTARAAISVRPPAASM